MSQSQVIIDQFHSPALEGNPLRDPATRPVPVYLPPDYDDTDTRYPVIYLLSSFAARGLELLNDKMWEENIQQRLDRLINTGAIQPIIAVMPDASTRLGGSQYMNSSATGDYEDHILELVEHIDGSYRTLPNRDQRAVLGHSSGGYGALRFSMRHPETFSMVAAHAADLYFEIVYRPDFPKFLRFYDRAGEEGLRQLIQDPGGMLEKGTSFYALAVLAMAACYSPNPNAPHGFDLPFDTFTGELLPEVWARWQANDPIVMLEDHLDALRSLKLLYLDCGKYDEEDLLYGARILSKKLAGHDIPHTFEEFEGGHRNTKYRYDVSLQLISQTIGQDTP